MALRVALQIDGDAKGAEAAASAASDALSRMGKTGEDVAKTLHDRFDKATGKAAELAQSAKAAGAANDNLVNSSLGLIGKLDEIAAKGLGAESALVKVSTGTVSVAKGLASLSVAGGVIGLITGALGIAATAATTYFAVVNGGSAESKTRLEESIRLINASRDAYTGAARAAGDLKAETREMLLLQLQQSAIALRSDLEKQVKPLTRSATPFPAAQALGGEFSVLDQTADAAAGSLGPLREAADALLASLQRGEPDVEAYQATVAKIGLAAQSSSPGIAAFAVSLLKAAGDASETSDKLRKVEASIALHTGRASESEKKLLGIATAAGQTGGELDRMVKAIERQAAAQEAEGAAAGRSAGEAARLRAEFLLLESAQQAGIKVSVEYAAQIDKVSSRLGNAVQKAAEWRLQSDLKFEGGQLGRTQTEASVADRLRLAVGNDVEPAMNGAIAGTIRFNERLRELKGTTLELAQGTFREFRMELANGANGWTAFGNAGVNALGRIADKMADKALDSIVSKIFGSLDGGTGSSAGSGGLMKLLGFAGGGYTGDGEKHDPAGVVHKGEFVFDAASTRRIGVQNLYSQMRGYAEGGLVGDPPIASRSDATFSRTQTPSVVLNDNRTYDFSGASSETVARLRSELERDRAERYYQVVDIVKSATEARDL